MFLNANVFKYKYIGKYFKTFSFIFRIYYYVGKRKATQVISVMFI